MNANTTPLKYALTIEPELSWLINHHNAIAFNPSVDKNSKLQLDDVKSKTKPNTNKRKGNHVVGKKTADHKSKRNTMSEAIEFPPLDYRSVGEITSVRDKIGTPRLQLGGSYNVFHDLPFHAARCSIFEEQFMPYKLSSEHFKVRHGILLWPRLNLSAYTDIESPQVVYILHNNEFIAEFIFAEDRVIINEVERFVSANRGRELMADMKKAKQNQIEADRICVVNNHLNEELMDAVVTRDRYIERQKQLNEKPPSGRFTTNAVVHDAPDMASHHSASIQELPTEQAIEPSASDEYGETHPNSVYFMHGDRNAGPASVVAYNDQGASDWDFGSNETNAGYHMQGENGQDGTNSTYTGDQPRVKRVSFADTANMDVDDEPIVEPVVTKQMYPALHFDEGAEHENGRFDEPPADMMFPPPPMSPAPSTSSSDESLVGGHTGRKKYAPNTPRLGRKKRKQVKGDDQDDGLAAKKLDPVPEGEVVNATSPSSMANSFLSKFKSRRRGTSDDSKSESK